MISQIHLKSKYDDLLGKWSEKLNQNRTLLALWLLMAVLYSIYSLLRHWHFQSNGCDLGIFDQAIWHYSRFEKPSCTVNGYSNLLGDHFHPTLALLAPLYWLFPKVETLLIAQAFLITFPMVPLFLFAKNKIGPFAAYSLAISYSVLGGVQSVAGFDFHEVCLAAAFTALAIYSLNEKRDKLFSLSILLLILTKEDMCLLASFFGFFLILKGRWKFGAVLAILSFLFLGFEIKVLIPYFSGQYNHWAYSQLGTDPIPAIKTFVFHPFHVLGLYVSNSSKVLTLVMLFAPFLFLGLFSPWALLAIPLISEKLLSDDPAFWGFNYQHYSIVLYVIMAFAAADGFGCILSRIKEKAFRRRLTQKLAGVILVLNLSLLPVTHYSSLSKLFKPSFYFLNHNERVGRDVLKLIPPNASVLAQSPIVPHLSHRQNIQLMRLSSLTEDHDEEYIIANRYIGTWPLKDFQVIEKCLNQKAENRYITLYDADGWIVLKRQ